MFPNLKSIDLRVKKLFIKIAKKIMLKACYSLYKRICLVFLCDNSNVRYHEKRGTLWPVNRHVKSAEILVVFPNLVSVLYLGPVLVFSTCLSRDQMTFTILRQIEGRKFPTHGLFSEAMV
jgi:hypothetical protein